MTLTDPKFFRQLDRLRIRMGAARGHRPGETPIPRTNQAWGVEFESHKEYAPGDDFRYLDWNAAGRLNQLLVKTFVAEREIPCHIMVDTSASMAAPAQDEKFAFTLDIAAALSYIVLSSNNTLRIVELSSPSKKYGPVHATPFLRHRARFQQVQSFFTPLVASGETYLQESIESYIGRTKEPGIVILISDFMVPSEHYRAAILFLVGRGYNVKALHIIGDKELHPERLFRRGKLRDIETQRERRITLNAANLEKYKKVLATHLRGIREFCHQHRVFYTCLTSTTPVSDAITNTLTRDGLLTIH